MRVIRVVIMRTMMHGSMSAPQRMVSADRSTTILPPTPRPKGRLGGSICRYSATCDEACNSPYFESNNEPNNAANDCRNIVLNNVSSNAPNIDGFKSG